MKKVLVIILVLANNLFSAEWKFDSFNESNVTSFCIDGNDIYAGASGRVYSSSDNGDNWTLLNLQNQTKNFGKISGIVKNQNKLFIASFEGLYTSTDLGKNWIVDTIYDEFSLKKVYEVSDIKKSGDDIFIISDLGKLFKSTDNGLSWDRITPDECVFLNKISIDGNNIYVAGDTIAGYANFWISNDYGKNWRKIQDTLGGLKKVNIQTLFAKDGNIFVSTTSHANRLFFSKDDGNSWEKFDNYPYNIVNIRSIIIDDNAIIVGGDVGYFTTTNWGKNWTETLIYDGISQITIINDNYYIATKGLGISLDKGKNFEIKKIGTGATNVISLVEHNNTIYSGTYYWGVFQTTDYGSTWQNFNHINATATDVSKIAFLDSNIFYTNPGTQKGKLIFSHDFGQNWKTLPVTAGIESINVKCIIVDSIKRNIFVGNQYGLYVSKDLGETWTLVHDDLKYIIPIDLIINNDTLYCVEPNSVFISTDYGLNWKRKIILEANGTITSIALCNNRIIAGIYTTTGEKQGIFISDDMGDNWVQVKDNSKNYDIYNITKNSNYLFAGTKHGVLISSNNGDNWNELDENIKFFQVNTLLISGGRIFIGTQEGILHASLSDLGITSVEDEVNISPDYLYSYPPYPTPSKEFVKFLLYYDQKTDISNDDISVIDLYGKKIAGNAEIVIDKQTNYSAILTWNTVGVADGVYIILVNHGSKKRAIKVIINR